MSEKPNPAETGELRGQLIKRLAVAGAIVALLLGILAVFDRIVTNSEDSEGPSFSTPVPVQPKKVLTQPLTPAEQPAEPVEPPPPPLVEEQPISPPAEDASKALPETPPLTRPDAVPAAPRASAAKVPKTAMPAEKAAPPVIAESTASPSIAPAPEPVVREAAPAPALPARAAEPSASTVRRLFSGFVLQAGVFSSVQRAEELRAQLQLGGVPATLETRVQIGPFKTRQEAEAAQEKLRKMGVETMLVPPKGAKN